MLCFSVYTFLLLERLNQFSTDFPPSHPFSFSVTHDLLHTGFVYVGPVSST